MSSLVINASGKTYIILYIPSTELNNRFNHAYRFCETLTGANYASGICYRVLFYRRLLCDDIEECLYSHLKKFCMNKVLSLAFFQLQARSSRVLQLVLQLLQEDAYPKTHL